MVSAREAVDGTPTQREFSVAGYVVGASPLKTVRSTNTDTQCTRTPTSGWPYDIVAEKSPYKRSLNTNAAKASPGDAFDSGPNMRRITNESSLFRNHEALHTQGSRAIRKLES